MSSETHVNAYKQTLSDELAKAHAAIGEIEKAFQNVVDKYERDLNSNAAPQESVAVDSAPVAQNPVAVENAVKPDGGNLPPQTSTSSK